MTTRAGDRFQEETKYRRGRMEGSGPESAAEPELYREYPDAPRVELPKPRELAEAPLHELLLRRRSVRDFAATELTLGQVGCLLWASGGVQRREHGYEFRTAPSAGALYPIETYVVANRVAGLASGVYHYSVRRHRLEELRRGDCGDALAAAALGQEMCADAAVTFIWTAVFQRSRAKYGQRAYRYVYLDAGHVAQNLALAAVALGLGSCQIGALYDDEVNELVGVDGREESVVYMSAVGVPAGS